MADIAGAAVAFAAYMLPPPVLVLLLVLIVYPLPTLMMPSVQTQYSVICC